MLLHACGGACRRSRRLVQKSPGVSRGLQGPQGTSRGLQALQEPPGGKGSPAPEKKAPKNLKLVLNDKSEAGCLGE